MKKRILFLITLALTSMAACAQSGQAITAVVSGMKFQIPDASLIVGALGQNNDILLIKYSLSAGKRYISFSTEDNLDTGGCERADFFTTAIGTKPESLCGENAVKSFQSVFRNDSDPGVWSDDQQDFYYFLSHNERSFVFFSTSDGHLVKLESDFLGSERLQEVLGIR